MQRVWVARQHHLQLFPHRKEFKLSTAWVQGFSHVVDKLILSLMCLMLVCMCGGLRVYQRNTSRFIVSIERLLLISFP